MKKIILLLAMIVLFSISVSANYTSSNVFITFASNGTINLSYTGYKNFTYDLSKNWIIVNKKTSSSFNSINYTVAAGERRLIIAESGILPTVGLNTSLPLRKGDYPKLINMTNSTSMDYVIMAKWINFSINETSTVGHFITFGNGATASINGNMEKVMKILNTTFYYYELPTYNTICNSTVALCAQDTHGNYQEKVAASTGVLITKNSIAGEPKVYSKATTITKVVWTSDYVSDWVSYDCTGTGETVFYNMNQLAGGSGYYVHYIDGTPNGYANTDTYTQSTCSLHTYSAVDTLPLSVSSPMSKNMVAIMVVIIALVLLIYSAFTIKNYDTWSTKRWILYFVTFIVVMVILATLMQILVGV